MQFLHLSRIRWAANFIAKRLTFHVQRCQSDVSQSLGLFSSYWAACKTEQAAKANWSTAISITKDHWYLTPNGRILLKHSIYNGWFIWFVSDLFQQLLTEWSHHTRMGQGSRYSIGLCVFFLFLFFFFESILFWAFFKKWWEFSSFLLGGWAYFVQQFPQWKEPSVLPLALLPSMHFE